MPLKTSQGEISEAIDATQWAASGDDAEAAAETRRRGRLSGPAAMAFLDFVMRTDNFASVTQRVRAATTLLEVGEFLASQAKPTGLFREPEGTDGGEGRATG